jgi:hypothetical protein
MLAKAMDRSKPKLFLRLTLAAAAIAILPVLVKGWECSSRSDCDYAGCSDVSHPQALKKKGDETPSIDHSNFTEIEIEWEEEFKNVMEIIEKKIEQKNIDAMCSMTLIMINQVAASQPEGKEQNVIIGR